MNYAIQVLENNGRNFKRSEMLKIYSDQCFEVAKGLGLKKRVEVLEIDEIIKDLKEVLETVCKGLKGWGTEHIEAKKRQEKKRRELIEAIDFLNKK